MVKMRWYFLVLILVTLCYGDEAKLRVDILFGGVVNTLTGSANDYLVGSNGTSPLLRSEGALSLTYLFHKKWGISTGFSLMGKGYKTGTIPLLSLEDVVVDTTEGGFRASSRSGFDGTDYGFYRNRSLLVAEFPLRVSFAPKGFEKSGLRLFAGFSASAVLKAEDHFYMTVNKESKGTEKTDTYRQDLFAEKEYELLKIVEKVDENGQVIKTDTVPVKIQYSYDKYFRKILAGAQWGAGYEKRINNFGIFGSFQMNLSLLSFHNLTPEGEEELLEYLPVLYTVNEFGPSPFNFVDFTPPYVAPQSEKALFLSYSLQLGASWYF